MTAERQEAAVPGLPESERIFRALFAQSAVGVAKVDTRSGRFVRVNQRYCDIVGLSAQEMTAATFMGITHPDDLQADLDDMHRLVSGEIRCFSMEKRYLHRDGSVVWVCLTVSPLWAPGEEPDFHLAMVEDITARKRIEEDLRRSEEKFAKAFHASPEPMSITSVTTRCLLDVNRSFERLSGWSRAEVVGRSSVELGLWVDPSVRERHIARLRETGLGEALEAEMRTRSGEVRVGQLVAELIELDGETCSLAVIRDITEQRRTQQALVASQERLERAQEHAHLGSWELDAGAGQAEWSAELYRLLGRDPAQGAPTVEEFLELIHPDDRDRIREAEARAAAGMAISSPDFRSNPERGPLRWFTSTIQTTTDDRGAVIRLCGTILDITERHRLEEQLLQAQKMEVVGQLAAGVAHDFNNLLAVIDGYTHVLLAQVGDQPRLCEELREIAAASERGARLTRQLLLASRKQAMQLASLDLGELLGGLGEMLRRTLGESIVLELARERDGARVRADRGMIEQVVANLAVNARDAMPRGGRLRIAVDVVDLGEAYASQIPQARPGRFVRLTVSDTGAGIRPEDLPRIFEPFFTTKDVGQGTGLGLATVYGIVAQHEGWIEVSSEVGRGSSFAVLLPAEAAQAEIVPVPERAATEAASGRGEVVLLVEDEPVVSRMLRQVLEGRGYRVLCAESGQEAREVWRQSGGRIDALLTDVVMPEGLSGFDLAAELRAEQPELRVVFMSGYSRGMAPGGEDLVEGVNYLQKPFPLPILLEVLRKQLDERC